MQVNEFLRNAVLELKDVDEAKLVPEVAIEALELDSLDFVEIQLGVKKTFGVNVEPEVFLNGTVKTFGDLVNYIEGRLPQPVNA